MRRYNWAKFAAGAAVATPGFIPALVFSPYSRVHGEVVLKWAAIDSFGRAHQKSFRTSGGWHADRVACRLEERGLANAVEGHLETPVS